MKQNPKYETKITLDKILRKQLQKSNCYFFLNSKMYFEKIAATTRKYK